MTPSGGTSATRLRPWLLAVVFAVLGCGDRYLSAILPGAPPSTPPPNENACEAVVPAGLLQPAPPMGWNGWNRFECGPGLTQVKFVANVEALLAKGLRDVGYRFVNLDECWQVGRSAEGLLTASPRFPDGMAYLANYAHQRGLKFGLNSVTLDCPRPEQLTPGSVGYEAKDAETFASWGVDYLKYRRCGDTPADQQPYYEAMQAALAQTGRSVVLSIADTPFREWQRTAGQLWRTGGNISPSWANLLEIIDANTRAAPYAGPGGFNDPDMLQVGNGELSEAENRAHFTMWAMMAAPLLAGNDLTDMTDTTAAILGNTEVIALDQDPLGLQGALVSSQGEVGVYAKPLAACGARGVVFLNRGDQPASASIAWEEIGLQPGSAEVRDLWAHEDLGPSANEVSVTVPARDVVALRVVGVEPLLPRGQVYLSDLRWTHAANRWGPVEKDTSNGETAAGDGKRLSLGGTTYEKGLGVHAPSLVRYRLGKRCTELSAVIGIDDDIRGVGSVNFQVWADGEKLFGSEAMISATPPRPISVDVSGRSELRLVVGENQDFTDDHAAWADARISCAP